MESLTRKYVAVSRMLIHGSLDVTIMNKETLILRRLMVYAVTERAHPPSKLINLKQIQLKFCCRNAGSVNVLIHIQLTPVIVVTCIISCIAMTLVCSSENPITLLCVKNSLSPHSHSLRTLSEPGRATMATGKKKRKKRNPALYFFIKVFNISFSKFL